MGQFKVEVVAVGGHGCQREKRDGEDVADCGEPSCPDCIARRFVNELTTKGSNVESATLTHWPGQPSQVVDDLKSGKRAGSF
jgi:hypothetical protein